MSNPIEQAPTSYDRAAGHVISVAKRLGAKLLFAFGVAYDATPDAQQLAKNVLQDNTDSNERNSQNN